MQVILIGMIAANLAALEIIELVIGILHLLRYLILMIMSYGKLSWIAEGTALQILRILIHILR